MSGEITHDRRHFLAVAAMGIIAHRLGLASSMIPGIARATAPRSSDGELNALARATEWLNTTPLSATGLRGKVVLVQFWTFTCVNWIRTLPYVRAWADKYKERGLVVIGAHSPEFSFERNLTNVRRSAKEMSVSYPIAVDNEFAIWRAFQNQYWPALYLIDAQGRNRYHRFGEGAYDDIERHIQQLLTENHASGGDGRLVAVEPRGLEVAADWGNLRSAENYLGFERTENFASAADRAPNRQHVYSVPSRLPLNHWGLSGTWTVAKDAITLNAPNGRIAYSFHGRDLNLVIGPATGTAPVRFRVLLDAHAPGAAHGTDTDEQGNGRATDQRVYQLIRQPGAITDRLFEIVFLDPGVVGFSFTFG
jgi:thiol-disulfide isomerase/thioredoxin